MVLAAKRVQENGNSNPPFPAGAVPASALGPAAPLLSLRSRSDFDIGLTEPRGWEGDEDVGVSPPLRTDVDGKLKWLSQAWMLGFHFSKASPDVQLTETALWFSLREPRVPSNPFFVHLGGSYRC